MYQSPSPEQRSSRWKRVLMMVIVGVALLANTAAPIARWIDPTITDDSIRQIYLYAFPVVLILAIAIGFGIPRSSRQ